MARNAQRHQADAGVWAMVSTLAAAVLATLGLSPAGHAAQPSQAFFVKGRGWGHGVGLAQYGAYGYALHGWTYDQIVAHYYPGTTLGDAALKKVRVLLVPGAKRIVVSSTSPFTVRDGSGKTHKLPAGRQELGPGLKLKPAAAGEAKALPGPLVFTPGTDPLVLGKRAYRGSLRVTATKTVRVVNSVGLEPYLWGVVPSEMPDRWPAEALEAQAMVARTYALGHLHKGGDFDLYPDTRSQVYGGIAAESPSASDAVDQTSGKVVMFKSDLADTFFFSSSGGKTANVQDVWPSPNPAPYLVSVPDPYDSLSPYHEWGPVRFTPAQLARRLRAPGLFLDVKADTAPSGRVRTLTVVGSNGERTMSGMAARTALGLRSNWFTIGLLNLTPPAAPVVYGSRVRLVGVARGVGRATLEARPFGGQWKALAKLASRNGQVAATLSPKVSTDYRLSAGEIRSGSVRLAVAPFVRIAASADRLSLTGLAKPLLPGAVVQVQRQAGSAWTTVARTTVAEDGTFGADVELTPGAYRARVTAGGGFAVGLSKVLTVVAA